MSRIGKKPITLPEGVTLDIKEGFIDVKGPKGELKVNIPEELTVELNEGAVEVKRLSETLRAKNLHGTIRSLLENAIIGVHEEFQKTLLIEGIGYRAIQRGEAVELEIGYSHKVIIEPEVNSRINVTKPTEIVVEGIDRQAVGQTAARIREVRPPEPYLGKGIRYKGERILRREGKRAGA